MKIEVATKICHGEIQIEKTKLNKVQYGETMNYGNPIEIIWHPKMPHNFF
jgi:hypothetical protein